MSSKYVCKDCGVAFDETAVIVEKHGFEEGPFEEISVCPECHSTNFCEAAECDECGLLFPSDELVLTDDGRAVCESCADEDTCPFNESAHVSQAQQYKDDELDHITYLCDYAMKAVTERPGVGSAYKMSKSPNWPLVKALLQDIFDHAETDVWYTIAQHDPSSKSMAEQLWDRHLADCILSTDTCPGQYREMLGTLILRYCWTHQMSAEDFSSLCNEAYHLCPRLHLPHIARYTDSREQSQGDIMLDIYRAADVGPSTCREKYSMTGIQIDDEYYALPTHVFRDMLLTKASESHAFAMSDESAKADRKQFVVNLGILLSQTREGITNAYLDDSEIVHVVYRNGYEELVNVRCDSYTAIIRDVAKEIKL